VLAGAVAVMLVLGAGAWWFASHARSTTAAHRVVEPAAAASTSPAPSVAPTPTPTPSVTLALPAGDHPMTVDVGGRTRTFTLHVPSGPLDGAPLALALVFHGFGGSATEAEQDSDLAQTADADGFLVAYLDGYAESWNDHNDYTPAEAAGVDDVAFTAAVLAQIETLAPVDSAHVTAVGFSNGAFFVNLLGCSLADRLTAIVTAEGQLTSPVAAACHPSRPLDVVQLNGTADARVPYDGGTPTFIGTVIHVLPAQESAARWAQLDGCNGTPTSSAQTGVMVSTYQSCLGKVTVQLRTIEGGDHNWPNALGPIVASTFD
jgi:polyhydroxybutyrate depolymerase